MLSLLESLLDASRLLSVSATPVVFISACGLVTLALYNRLGNVTARIRAFHGQKSDLLDSLAQHDSDEMTMRLAMLDSQIKAVTTKAKVIQRGLICLLAAMGMYLCCSLLAGAAGLHEIVGFVALGMEVLGTLLFLAGLGWAVREMSLSIVPLEEESAYLEAVTARRLTMAKGESDLTVNKQAA
jgi:hypothetical protein